MKERTPQEKVQQYCRNVREEIEQWKDINKNGCNDPFWSDGCNMNLTRNHIIYAQEQIQKITFHFQRNAIYQYHQKQILTIWHI